MNTETNIVSEAYSWDQARTHGGDRSRICASVIEQCRNTTLTGREYWAGIKTATYLDGAMWGLGCRDEHRKIIRPEVGDIVFYNHAAVKVQGIVVVRPDDDTVVDDGINGWPKFVPGIVMLRLWRYFVGSIDASRDTPQEGAQTP